MTNSVTKEIAIEIVGDLGMTHFPFNFSDFRAGWPGTTSVQNGTNLRGLQFLEIDEKKMNRSTTAPSQPKFVQWTAFRINPTRRWLHFLFD
jgi:hypothetical protein